MTIQLCQVVLFEGATVEISTVAPEQLWNRSKNSNFEYFAYVLARNICSREYFPYVLARNIAMPIRI